MGGYPRMAHTPSLICAVFRRERYRINSTQSGTSGCTFAARIPLLPLFDTMTALPPQPKYHTHLLELMSFVHGRATRYPKDTTFEPDVLGQLTPLQIKHGCARRCMALQTLENMTALNMAARPHWNSTRRQSLTTCPTN